MTEIIYHANYCVTKIRIVIMAEAEPSAKSKEDLDRSEIFVYLSESFQHIEREAIVYLLIETMHRSDIKLSESFKLSQMGNVCGELSREKKLHFMLIANMDQCIDDLLMMVDEGMLIRHIHKGKLHSLSIAPETKLAEVVGKYIKDR